MKDEHEYFTNQCFQEVRRVSMIDYDMGRENFVNMGEMMIRMIYQMNIGWQEFLSYYTGLNVGRKRYDEKFQEEKRIGEEMEIVEDEHNNSGSNPQNPAFNKPNLITISP